MQTTRLVDFLKNVKKYRGYVGATCRLMIADMCMK